MTMVWRAPLMFEPEGPSLSYAYFIDYERSASSFASSLCFARTASCEARAPFAGSIPGI